jgi:hypothetical protein
MILNHIVRILVSFLVKMCSVREWIETQKPDKNPFFIKENRKSILATWHWYKGFVMTGFFSFEDESNTEN